MSALENRFSHTRLKLRRVQRREEYLAKIKEDIEWLAQLAYTNAAPLMMEVLVKDQFINLTTDEDMKLKVHHSHPVIAACIRGRIAARVLQIGHQATHEDSPCSAA